MNPDSITIPVEIDAQIFQKFAVFDTIYRQKKFVSPAIFAGILLFFSAVCFFFHSRADQAVFIGSVLLTIALGLPAVYFGMFLRSVQTQARLMQLHPPRHVYTVELTGQSEGVTVTGIPSGSPRAGRRDSTAASEVLRCRWDSLYGAYRLRGCIYLYISARQAFLLPDGQAEVSPDELWDFLCLRLPGEKVCDCRRRR